MHLRRVTGAADAAVLRLTLQGAGASCGRHGSAAPPRPAPPRAALPWPGLPGAVVPLCRQSPLPSSLAAMNARCTIWLQDLTCST